MPDGEDARVKAVQPSFAKPEIDRVVTQPERAKLPSLHHPVLSPSQLRHRRIPSSPLRLPFAVV